MTLLTLLQIKNTVQGEFQLWQFLNSVVPDVVPFDKEGTKIQTKEELLADVYDAVTSLTMSARIT